ncbi:MAG: hypothetical protein L6U16_11305 [Porphyromonadaceae bacterium]|nr:MAG: hypothetical protein L6U16_11305 [Porphyromonadaceae bacterium]
MILASALTFGIANAKNDEYKHDNCYNYMRGLEAVQNEDNDEAIKYLKSRSGTAPQLRPCIPAAGCNLRQSR